MLYWLFTDGRSVFSGLLWPLACISPILIVATAIALGSGIRRDRDEQQTFHVRHIIMAAAYIAALSLVTTLYLFALGEQAVKRGRNASSGPIDAVSGAPRGINSMRLFLFAALLAFLLTVTSLALHAALRDGGWLRERLDRLRTPAVKRGALGSSHFCTMREYRRFRRPDADGLMLLGAFWGEQKRRLDAGTGRLCLGGEDIARGLLTLGGPGSGKTQGIILPAIADRMLAGHSLIVADPQGELTEHILRYAAVTRHLVVVHDPTSSFGPRYNLVEGINNVSDARSISDVLVPTALGDNRFWTDSAAALLAACLIRFDNLGAIYSAMNDVKRLAAKLTSKKDDAALLANSFAASVGTDGKVAANIIASLATALTGWASVDVRANTAASDFDAALIVEQPTVVVLTCPGRMRAVYASYLGATLRKLMLDLDTIGERNKGPLPVPVGVILDEFPTLGKLDSLVADVNLVRKRRISILIGAQTKGQFEMIYGREGTQALFTGLATQVIYGGCDVDTAEFYSKASGTATTDANMDDPNSHLRQRPLLTIDEVITPQVGNCTIFARYAEAGYATQVIFNARLTRFYEREDWKRRLSITDGEVLRLERGVELRVHSDKSQDMSEEQIRSEEEERSAVERHVRAMLASIPDEEPLFMPNGPKAPSLSEQRARRQAAIQQERLL
jgi:type IV secretory pathway TraG/TraD family ATPase VirD4